MESIQSFSANTYETKPNKPKSGVGSGLFYFGLTTCIPLSILSPMIINRLNKLSGNLTVDEVNLIDKAVAKLVEQTGLKQKGLEIVKVSAQNAEEIKKMILNETEIGVFKSFPKPIKKIINWYDSFIYKQLIQGENACFSHLQKKIFVPEKGLGASLPHEMGHAMNYLSNKSSRILQKCRPLSWLTLPIGLIAVFKDKKSEGEKPKNFIDKTTTFIKNHAPALVIASFLPSIIEEGLASVRGYKAVKKFVTPELVQKIRVTNIISLAGYVLVAAALALGIREGRNAKDRAHQMSLDEINK